MKKVVLKARAKINWTLDIVGRRPDGYHDLETVMQSIDLWDIVVLEKIEKGICLESNVHDIPKNNDNIAWKAAEAVKKEFGIDAGVKINISKNIPVAAGLAGGSTNAAAVLAGLNYLWDLSMSEQDMMKFGKMLGADVPFCLKGGSALARGIGERLTAFAGEGPIWLVIVNPPIKISTRNVFNLWDKSSTLSVKKPDTEKMIQALSMGDIYRIGDAMGNVLESVTASIYPEILEIKQKLIRCGAVNSLMSGSGPSVYGIFEDEIKAKQAAKLLKGNKERIFVVSTSDKGIEFTEES